MDVLQKLWRLNAYNELNTNYAKWRKESFSSNDCISNFWFRQYQRNKNVQNNIYLRKLCTTKAIRGEMRTFYIDMTATDTFVRDGVHITSVRRRLEACRFHYWRVVNKCKCWNSWLQSTESPFSLYISGSNFFWMGKGRGKITRHSLNEMLIIPPRLLRTKSVWRGIRSI